MNRRLVIIASVAAAALSFGFWQVSQPQSSLAEKLPPGALLYLEAADFGGLLGEWNGSREKAEWVKSPNYESVARTRLLGRLGSAGDEFTAASGLPNDLDLLNSVAGGQSALAIYDIGNMKFVYLSRLSAAKLAQTKLWQARGTFQARSASGKTYFAKTDAGSKRVASFAHDGDLLILATGENLMSATLAQLTATTGSLRSEPWFDAVWNAAGNNGALRMVYNMQALVRSPHFRSYWIQHNVSELKPFNSGAATLTRSGREWVESRVLLRGEPTVANPVSLDGLRSLVPQTAGAFRAWATPDPVQLTALIGTRILGSQARQGSLQQAQFQQAPQESGIVEQGFSGDLESRLDDAPVEEKGAAFNAAPLEDLFRNNAPKAVLTLGATHLAADQVFHAIDAAVVVELTSAVTTEAWTSAVSASMAGLHSASQLGMRWRAKSNYQALDGLLPVFGTMSGTRLVLSNSEKFLTEILAGSTTPALDPTTIYFAEVRHNQERGAFQAMMRLIDSSSPQPPQEGAAPREPLMFSENLASLSTLLRRFDAATVIRRDLGNQIQETVTYRLGQ